MSSEPLVLVTGGTGFVGSHVILQLLESGFRVRATVRDSKTAQLLSSYPQPAFKDLLDVVEIADIATGDFTTAFKGVSSLIHVASPIVTSLSGGGDSTVILKSAIEGTENVIGQAIKAGVKNIVYTSSFAALFDPDLRGAFTTMTANENSWSIVKHEDITPNRHFTWAYVASKPLAEKKAWELAEANPDVNLTTIIPPMIYGAPIPHAPYPKFRSALGTNEYIYHLIAGGPDGSKTYPRQGVSHYVSVKDVARAHILALSAPPLPNNSRKRLLLSGGRFTYPEAAAYIASVRPELKERLEKDESGPKFVSCCEMDMSLTDQVVGMRPRGNKEGNMIGWEECVLETVDWLLEWEKADAAGV